MNGCRRGAAASPPQPLRYEIVVGSRVPARWAGSFEGFELSDAADGGTRLVGDVPDQAALFGLLARIRDLNLPLLGLRRLEADKPVSQPEEN